MRAVFLVAGLIIVLAVMAGVWRSQSQAVTAPSTTTDSLLPRQGLRAGSGGERAPPHDQQPAKQLVTPNATGLEPLPSMPGQERPEEPGTQAPQIEKIIRPSASHKNADVQEAQRLLGALDPAKLTPQEKAALRWSLFEAAAHETIRNDTANVLLNAGDPELAGALCAQLKDPKQTPLWRNYCVQHLAVGYRRLEKHETVIRAIFRAAEQDPAAEVRDAGLLHLSRLAIEPPWQKTQPAWHQRVTLLTKRFLSEEGRGEIERISGARGAGELGMIDEAPRLLGWLGEATTPLGERQAAASVLAVLWKNCDDKVRKEIVVALKSAAQDRNRMLRQVAQQGLKDLGE